MLPLVAYTPAARRLLSLVVGVFVSLSTLRSVEATGLAVQQAASQQETPIDSAVRQCNDAWQHGKWKDAKKLCSGLLEQANQLPANST
jgi:hypothetical protein